MAEQNTVLCTCQ